MRSVFAAALMATTSVGLIGGFAAPMAHAQSTETIRSIIVDGNQRIDDRTVVSYLLVEPGDAFDPDRIDLSLKTLFAPVLPFSSQQLHEMLGYPGSIFGAQEIKEYREPEKTHLALTFDAGALTERWEPSQLPAGQTCCGSRPYADLAGGVGRAGPRRSLSNASCISVADANRSSRSLASAFITAAASDSGTSGLRSAGLTGSSSRCFAIRAGRLGALNTTLPVRHS